MGRVAKNLRTEKALIDSGAYVPGDFEDSPMVMKQAEKPAKGIGKQVSQTEYDRQLSEQKRKQAEGYARYKAKR
jgi:hypothetical protein